jgi:hypothetical protein
MNSTGALCESAKAKAEAEKLGACVRQDGVARCQKRCRRRQLNLCWRGVERLEGLCAILSKWFLPTRLETRTKESKTNASMVVEKPTCEMKVNDAKLCSSIDRP